MNFFDIILWPFKWVIELILVSAHNGLTAVGFSATSGLTWVLSIVALVIVVRAAMIPLFVNTVRSAQKLADLAPELKAVRESYDGKNDPVSRAALGEEMVAIYKKANANPFAPFAPLLIQLPIFVSLFAVLNNAVRSSEAGVGWFSKELAVQANAAAVFGAPLHESLTSGVAAGLWSVAVIVPAIIVVMTVAQYITLRWSTAGQVTAEGKMNTSAKVQMGLLWLFTGVFIFSGLAFPLSLMFYMLSSTLWTTAQQFVLLQVQKGKAKSAALLAEIAELDAEIAELEAGETETEPDAGEASSSVGDK